MSTERPGAAITVDIGKGGDVKMTVMPVYPSEDPDASPQWWIVTVYHKVTETTMSRDDVRKVLSAFGGLPNDW